jgi:hypothetical protein
LHTVPDVDSAADIVRSAKPVNNHFLTSNTSLSVPDLTSRSAKWLCTAESRSCGKRSQIHFLISPTMHDLGRSRTNDQNRVKVRNKAAAEVMTKEKIPIDDLFAFVAEKPGWSSNDGVPLNAKGSTAMGEQVVEILKAHSGAE